jgi:hypothetical protein
LHRRLSGFSTERLMGFLTALGSDVEVVARTPMRLAPAGSPARVIAA